MIRPDVFYKIYAAHCASIGALLSGHGFCYTVSRILMELKACGVCIYDLGSQAQKSKLLKTDLFSEKLHRFCGKALSRRGIFREKHSRFTGHGRRIYMLEINTSYGLIRFLQDDDVLPNRPCRNFLIKPPSMFLSTDGNAVIEIRDGPVRISPSEHRFSIIMCDGA